MAKMKFQVIIPFYNCEEYIVKCLQSIMTQTYKECDVILINDASTDNSDKAIRDVFDLGTRIKYIHNNRNVGALQNIVMAINEYITDPEDVIILIDGDDWLEDDTVLQRIHDEYQNPDIWLTYGQYRNLSKKYRGICAQLTNTRRYRKRNWVTSHLRTFKKHLWSKIKDEDLRDSSGNYYPMAWDLAFMYPMIEMAGLKRIKYIRDILYVYNDNNPLNDDRKNRQLQIDLGGEIKNKSQYDEIS